MKMRQQSTLITGAASGIGKGIAQRFVEAGASVAILDIQAEAAKETAAALSKAGRAIALAGDVSREEDVKAAVETTVAQFGGLDILINNAGVEIFGTAPELTAEQWDRQIGVNLKGVFLCSKHAVPRMQAGGGAIVNIVSIHAIVSYLGTAAYDASKAGLIGLTRAMALDHGPEGIRVNAICPGYIDTPMLSQWANLQPDPKAAMDQIAKLHPVRRIGTPRDIAEAALFLASDAASFITGATLVVDGGLTVLGH